MKLAISNIAWPYEQELAFLRDIKKWGCTGVEIAPSRAWPEPVQSSSQERKKFKSVIDDSGLKCVAMQALLYSRPDLGLFRDKAIEIQTIKYLQSLCILAADLQIPVLVFGSPRSRKRGEIPPTEAMERASEFFYKVAIVAERENVCFCIEPLMPQETDFINTAKEGLRLVKMVDSSGFGLHLDAKAVFSEKNNIIDVVGLAKNKLQHFHINDPDLVEVNSTGTIDHNLLSEALNNIDYDGFVSIEMRQQKDYLSSVKKSISFSKEVYQ
jgi:sugar phosphate isomerase/epimerase